MSGCQHRFTPLLDTCIFCLERGKVIRLREENERLKKDNDREVTHSYRVLNENIKLREALEYYARDCKPGCAPCNHLIARVALGTGKK